MQIIKVRSGNSGIWECFQGKHFCLSSQFGSALKWKEGLAPFWNHPNGFIAGSREKLSPFVKVVENHGDVKSQTKLQQLTLLLFFYFSLLSFEENKA